MLVPWLGGPIVKCPLIYNSFWGPLWSDPAHRALANQINQFTQDLLYSEFMNVLSQYGLLGGAGSGLFIRASYLPGVPGTLTVSSYEAIIQQCINAGVFPQPANLQTSVSAPVLMIYLDDHTIINGGGRELNFPGAPDIGYHDSFVTSNGQPCPYAFMAYFSNVNMTTVVASHEFAEMVTDPLYNAWTPDHAFHEIGDYCEGNNATITALFPLNGRTWTVQTIWSDTDNACIAQSPSPLPHLVPGPLAAVGAGLQGVVRGFAQHDPGRSHQRMLPLPAVTFDVAGGTHSMDQKDVHNYVRKMFYPATHNMLFSDLPGFLRTIGGMLEQLAESAPAPTGEPSAPAGDSTRRPGVARPGTCKTCSES
jgi:hypothetical protein